MSNARERAYIEGLNAPMIAWLVDHGYVANDCGILNPRWNWKDGIRFAMNALSTMPMKPARERL
jgi:hypothetical protein